MRKEKLEELKDYILELKTIKRERLEEEYKYENGVVIGRKGFLNIENYKCYLNNGEIIRREKISNFDKYLQLNIPCLCFLLKILRYYILLV